MSAIHGDLYHSLPEFVDGSEIWHGFGTRGLSLPVLEAQAARRGMRSVFLDQKHSDVAHILTGFPRGDPEAGDALVTDRRGILLVIRTADCLPVLLSDSKRGVVAAVHCGWRGTGLEILRKVVRSLQERFGSAASDLTAALGPCIAPACYEVGEDVRRTFADRGYPTDVILPLRDTPGKYLFDLRTANLHQLRGAGLREANIFPISCCTHCEKNLYSYRRDAHKAGRLLNFIGRCL